MRTTHKRERSGAESLPSKERATKLKPMTMKAIDATLGLQFSSRQRRMR